MSRFSLHLSNITVNERCGDVGISLHLVVREPLQKFLSSLYSILSSMTFIGISLHFVDGKLLKKVFSRLCHWSYNIITNHYCSRLKYRRVICQVDVINHQKQVSYKDIEQNTSQHPVDHIFSRAKCAVNFGSLFPICKVIIYQIKSREGKTISI